MARVWYAILIVLIHVKKIGCRPGTDCSGPSFGQNWCVLKGQWCVGSRRDWKYGWSRPSFYALSRAWAVSVSEGEKIKRDMFNFTCSQKGGIFCNHATPNFISNFNNRYPDLSKEIYIVSVHQRVHEIWVCLFSFKSFCFC